MMIRSGIARRLTLLTWTVTLTTLGIFVAIMLPQEKRNLNVELESKGNGIAAAVEGEVAGGAVSEDYSAVVERAQEVMKGDKAVDFLVITRNDGFSVVIERSGWRVDRKIDHVWYPDRRHPFSELGFVPLFNRRVFHYAVPFDYSGINWGWIHVGLTLDSYDESARQMNLRTGIVVVLCILISLLVSVMYAKEVAKPILRLRSAAERIASGDLTARTEIRSRDEIGQLSQVFDGMADTILHRNRELSEAKRDLENRVQERTQDLQDQIVAKDTALSELAEAQKRLIDLSRISGMAEVATGVLHNVGNVLNSVNVSATVLADKLRESRVNQIGELVGNLLDHTSDIGDFVTNDPRGRRMLPYLANLSRHLEKERDQLGVEVASLVQNITHIKQIVAMQQAHARTVGVYENIALSDVIKDAIDITLPGIERHGISLAIEGEEVPHVLTDRHRVLEILLNLLRNAKDAVREAAHRNPRITICTQQVGTERVAVRVADNGIGIPAADLVRVFAHGFTTKVHGHGFGLHSSALTANQLGGALTAESDGANAGATFTLELPIRIGANAEKGQNS